MNIIEHLERIEAKCRANLALAEIGDAKSGWLATIAAIETCRPLTDENMPLAKSIIDAWPNDD